MDTSTKEYKEHFLLEPTKLERLVAVIHERLSERVHDDNVPSLITDRFQVYMSGNRCDELTTLDQVLSLENSKRHRIERLSIVSWSETQQLEVLVDFGVYESLKAQPKAGPVKHVKIETRSMSPNWNRQTLSQIEEQVERTWVKQIGSVVILVSMVLLLGVLFLIQFTPRVRADGSKTYWLGSDELNVIEKAVNENRSLSSDELRQIVTGQYRNIVLAQRPQPEQRQGNNWLILFFGIPYVLIGAVSVYLAVKCYPDTVFLWGDEINRYKDMIHRRRVLWGVIVTVFLGGVVSKFLSEGLLSIIKK